MDKSDLTRVLLSAREELDLCVAGLDWRSLWPLVCQIDLAGRDAYTIWTMGNGGSAANASHFAEDLGLAGIRAVCLSADSPRLTALANDFGYPEIFARQVEVCARPGDLVFVLSVSGDSPSVIQAASAAKAMGIGTAGMTGKHGGKVWPLLDYRVRVPGMNFGIVETVHLLLCHVISDTLRLRPVAA